MANPCDEGKGKGVGRVAEAGDRGWEKEAEEKCSVCPSVIWRIDLLSN